MNKETVVVQVQEQTKISIFSWSNINLKVNISKSEDKQLLSGISGNIKAGEIIAIMGGSGAGKSTLLNTLAGRLDPSTILSGDVLIDGKERSANSWRSLCAYVEQDDLLYDSLTVFETLLYSAKLRLPSSITLKEKIDRVNAVILQLGLDGCRDTRIGSPEKRGISGGERKRVSIGIEMVTNPDILFLDEPTSGLDAFNAFNAMETLKKLAKEENKIILLTIHQPRTDILDLFDKIILLSLGKQVWMGSTHDAIGHFESLGMVFID